jgi:hypothetical protein
MRKDGQQVVFTQYSYSWLNYDSRKKSDYNENKRQTVKRSLLNSGSTAAKPEVSHRLSALRSIKASHFSTPPFFNLSSPASFTNNHLKNQTKKHQHACRQIYQILISQSRRQRGR